MEENASRNDPVAVEPEPAKDTIIGLIRSLSDPDPGVQVQAAKELGHRAMKGNAHEIAEAGGVRKLIDCFSAGESEVKNASAHALRNCAEGGAVEGIIREGGFPILQGMVLYGNWNASPHVIESLSEMKHPEAILLIQEIVNRKANALERDTFRDVYEMIREPFSSQGTENDDQDHELNDPDQFLSNTDTDGEFRDLSDDSAGDPISPEKGGIHPGTKPRSVRDSMKHALSPIVHLGSGIKRSVSGNDERGRSYPGSHVPAKDDIPSLISRLDDVGSLEESELHGILNQLHFFVKRGWGDQLIGHGGIRKVLSVMNPSKDDIGTSSDSSDDVVIAVHTSNVDNRGLSEAIVSGLIKDLDEWDVEGTDLVEQLCSGFTSPDPYVRSFALRSLREMDQKVKPSEIVKKHGIRSILTLLDDVDPDIQYLTIRFLSELGSSRAIKPLRKFAENENDPKLSRAVLIALERLA